LAQIKDFLWKLRSGGKKKKMLFNLVVLGSSLLYGLLLRSSVIPSLESSMRDEMACRKGA